MSTHAPVHRSLEPPQGFYDKRKHIFESIRRVTNHDALAFLLFCKLLDSLKKQTITVVEFGVWRASFLENLCIHAEEHGKKLVIYGFDSFNNFPDSVAHQDLRSRTRDEYEQALANNPPFSIEQVRARLSKYACVQELHLIQGNICELTPGPKIDADLVHYDMDFYMAFFAAMKWIKDTGTCTLLVDDYYQPSWVGMVDAVNEYGAKHGLYPVNLSDYFRIERSHRTQHIAILSRLLSTNPST
jgi:hypothetical protein